MERSDRKEAESRRHRVSRYPAGHDRPQKPLPAPVPIMVLLGSQSYRAQGDLTGHVARLPEPAKTVVEWQAMIANGHAQTGARESICQLALHGMAHCLRCDTHGRWLWSVVERAQHATTDTRGSGGG